MLIMGRRGCLGREGRRESNLEGKKEEGRTLGRSDKERDEGRKRGSKPQAGKDEERKCQREEFGREA